MSGLAQFFRLFTPNTGIVTTTIEESEEEHGPLQLDHQQNKNREAYDQSLLATATADENDDESDEDDNDDANSNDTRGSIGSSNRRNDGDDSDDGYDTQDGDEERGMMTFKEWKRGRNATLTNFLVQRMLPKEEYDRKEPDESEIEEGSEEEDESEEEVERFVFDRQEDPESQENLGLESQPLDPESQEIHNATNTTTVQPPKRQSRRKRIFPVIEDAVHDVSNLDDIDLFARTATIALAQANKLVGLRSLKRFLAMGTMCPRYDNDGGKNPFQFDGPLSTAYKDAVISFDISQLHVEPLNPTRRRQTTTVTSATLGGETGTEESTSQKKMRIFLYDDYAECLNRCLINDDHHYNPKVHVLLVALRDVPGISVLPYPYNNWYEQQEMMQESLCFGGGNRMRLEVNDWSVKPRFDSEDLSIVVALGNKQTGDFVEYIIEKSTVASEIVKEPTSTLSVLYRAWQEQWNIVPRLGEPGDAPQQQRQLQQLSGVPAGTTARQGERNASATPRLRNASEPPAGLPDAKRTKPLVEYFKMSALRPLLTASKQRNQHQCQANVYGVVIGFGAATQTKTGDWFMNVTLVDESIVDDENHSNAEEKMLTPIPLSIFCKKIHQLPDLRRAGEVLRLHRVIVQEFREELQLRAQRSTGFSVYRGSANHAQFDPAAISAPGKCTMTAGCEQRFHSLWQWGKFCLSHHATIKGSEQRTLEQVLHQDDSRVATSDNSQDYIGDYTVMVTSILPFPQHLRNQITPAGFLRVWDGTGFSDSDRYPFAILAPAQANNDPPSEALVAISKIKECRDGRPPLTIPQRLCGRVMNVAIWETSHWNLVGHLKVGEFIRLRNVKESFFPEIGIRCLQVASKSWLTPMPEYTFEVADLLAAHSRRINHNHPTNPKSGVLPLDISNTQENNDEMDVEGVNSGEDANCSSLSQLAGERSGALFVGKVCVEATLPAVSEAVEMEHLCPIVSDSDPRGYRFAITLNDGEDSVMAIVSDAVGTQFFGMPAEEAIGNGASAAYEVLSCIENCRSYQAEVQNVVLEGQTFFLLNSISPL